MNNKPLTSFKPKAEKAGYTLWEDNIIIEEVEIVMVLVEMEMGE